MRVQMLRFDATIHSDTWHKKHLADGREEIHSDIHLMHNLPTVIWLALKKKALRKIEPRDEPETLIEARRFVEHEQNYGTESEINLAKELQGKYVLWWEYPYREYDTYECEFLVVEELEKAKCIRMKLSRLKA